MAERLGNLWCPKLHGFFGVSGVGVLHTCTGKMRRAEIRSNAEVVGYTKTASIVPGFSRYQCSREAVEFGSRLGTL
jgi:hypothetical protein